MSHSPQTRYILSSTLWSGSLIFILFLLVAISNPFLKLPFDPWEHLIKIRSIFDTGNCFLYWPGDSSTFYSWHLFWATLFKFLQIDDTLLWARIIHFTQFSIALACTFSFSYAVLRICLKDCKVHNLYLISSFATLYWLVGNGTYSVNLQQAWIMWYSVTYQGITIPVFWLITGLTLQLLFSTTLSSTHKKVIPPIILTGFLIIAFFHPSEAIYYFIFLLLGLCLTPSIGSKKKILWTGILLVILPLTLFVIGSSMKLPFLQNLSIHSDFSSLTQQVGRTGTWISTGGGNRVGSSFSELASFASITALLFWVILWLLKKREMPPIIHLLSIAVIMFYLIPTSKWIAGIAGTLLNEDIIWRFFFASPWFIFPPLICYLITSSSRFPRMYTTLLLTGILLVSYSFSLNSTNQALSGNTRSLYNSFFKERVNLQYNDQDLLILKNSIHQQTRTLKKDTTMLYLRSDLATLARALWGYYTYSHRRIFIPMHKFYSMGLNDQYKLVPITLPSGFPKSREIFLKFNLDSRKISTLQNIIVKADSPVVFDVDHIDLGRKYLFIEGWAFLKKQTSNSDVYIVLRSEQRTQVFNTSELYRRDVGKRFNSIALENSGFLATIPRATLPKETYKIEIIVQQNDIQGHASTERSITIY